MRPRRIGSSHVASAESALPAEPTLHDGKRISRTDPAFWRVTAPLAFGGFSTFALLYNVQPLLPLFSRAFAISPASAALSVSLSTIVLSVSMIGAGDRRRPVGPQDRHGGFDRAVVAGDPARRCGAELDRAFWRCARSPA